MNLRFSAPLVAITLLAVPAATPAATFVIIDILNDSGLSGGGGIATTVTTTRPITNPALGNYTSTVGWTNTGAFENYGPGGAAPRQTSSTLPDGSSIGNGYEVNQGAAQSTTVASFSIPISASSAAGDIGFFDLSFYADFRNTAGVPTVDLVNTTTGVSYLGGAQNVDLTNGTNSAATTAWTLNSFPTISSAGTSPGDTFELSFANSVAGGSNGLELTHVTLTWAPEPSRAMLLMAGMLACVLRRRR